ncbi:MAG: hypothetical protein ACJ72O_06285 [Marmoricola sp.]
MFIQVMQAKCSRPDEVRAFADKWSQDVTDGYLGGTFGVTDDGDFLAVVRFASAEAAAANSSRPETDALSREFGALMDGPIEFADCDDVTQIRGGGSDDAAFVQVIRGRVDDADRAKALAQGFSDMTEVRPDVIGGTLAIAADGGFTQTVYFTGEDAARAGEQGDPPPAEVESEISWMMDGASFYDLRSPWFEGA